MYLKKNITLFIVTINISLYSMTPSPELAADLAALGTGTQSLSILLQGMPLVATDSTSSSSLISSATPSESGNLTNFNSECTNTQLTSLLPSNTLRSNSLPSNSVGSSSSASSKPDIISLLLKSNESLKDVGIDKESAKNNKLIESQDDSDDEVIAHKSKRNRIEGALKTEHRCNGKVKALTSGTKAYNPIERVFGCLDFIKIINSFAISNARELALWSGTNKTVKSSLKDENLKRFLFGLTNKITYLDIATQKRLMTPINYYLAKLETAKKKTMPSYPLSYSNIPSWPEEYRKNYLEDFNAMRNLLSFAMKYNNLAVLQNLCARGVRYCYQPVITSYDLYIAIDKGFEDIVFFILRNDPDLFNTCKNKNLISDIVCNTKNAEMLEKILSFIKDRFQTDPNYKTLMHSFNGNILFDCIINNNPEYLQICMNYCDDYTVLNKEEKTILHLACLFNNKVIIDYLLDNLSNDILQLCTTPDKFYTTPIMFACAFNNKEILHKLITKQKNICQMEQVNILIYCIKNNNFDLFDLFLSKIDNRTPGYIKSIINYSFYIACQKTKFDLDTLKLLINKYKPDLEYTPNDIHPQPPILTIFNAQKDLNPKIIEYLLELGTLITPQIFKIVLMNCNYEILSIYLNYMPLSSCDQFGDSILHNAIFNDDFERIFEHLLKENFNINVKNNKGQNVIQNFINSGRSISSSGAKFIDILIKADIDINNEDNEGNTVLFNFFMMPQWGKPNKFNLIQNLVKNGANLKHRNNKGHTLFQHILFSERNGIIPELEMLLDLGYTLDEIDINRNTPLHQYMLYPNGNDDGINAHIDTIRLLIDYGANITTPNSEGDTPLHLFIKNFDTLIINNRFTDNPTEQDYNNEDLDLDFINSCKEAYRIKNKDGQTAYDIAVLRAASLSYLNNKPLRDKLLEIMDLINPALKIKY